MANHFIIPRLNPFWFVKNQATPGIHLDDSWWCERIKTSFMRRVKYCQKWVKTDTTILQIESSIAPDTLKIYNESGTVAKIIAWTEVFAEVNYKVYECTFDISDLPEGKYWLYQRAALMSVDWPSISEPIHSKANWPNTVLITYKNSYNRDGIAWTTGVEMKFRVEAAIMEDEPDAEITSYINQTRDTEILDGTAFTKYKLFIGDAAGVAPYILNILNRIFLQNYTSIEGKKYVRNGNVQVEVTKQKNYALQAGSLEIVEADNLDGLHFSDPAPIAPGIVTAYNIETTFFGPGALIPVTDVEEQG